jgi:flagellar hook assembly protein FlgD
MGAAAAIRFALARSGGAVTLDVLDVRGRLVRRLAGGPLPGGEHGLDWDGLAASGVPAPPGVYFIRLASPDLGIATAKLVLLR